MTLKEIRDLVRNSSADILISFDIVDTSLNNIIYGNLMQIFKRLCDKGYNYYKENIQDIITQAGNNFEIPLSNVYKIISGYIIKDNRSYYLNMVEYENLPACLNYDFVFNTISYNNRTVVLFVNSVSAPFNYFISYYAYPDKPQLDDDEVMVPPEYINYLVVLCKKQLYIRNNWDIPKDVLDEIKDFEFKINNKVN